MNPKEWLEKFHIICGVETPIHDLKITTKKLERNDVFIACKGKNHSALEFIDEAFMKGALLILVDEPIERENVIYIENLASMKGQLAYAFYGRDFESIPLIGITGTNGKTSVTSLLTRALQCFAYQVMEIGTLGARCGTFYEDLENTTPDVVTLARLFALAKKMGCDFIIMEVSSHSIALNRIESLAFDVCVFTNISSEHLDYHRTFLEYLTVKSRFFTYLKKDGLALINEDDENAHFMIKNCKNGKVLTYGKASLDCKITNIDESQKGLSFMLNEIPFETKLLGWFNAYNLAPCYLYLKKLQKTDAEIIEAFKKAKPIEGRLERLMIDKVSVIVDFAHTPDAMEKVITYVKRFQKGKLICIFGCGGDRDKSKRPQMGRIATTFCDYVIISDDNPRFENPHEIMLDIIKGIRKANYSIIFDRKMAIKTGLQMLSKEDTLLILGKGHECYQIYQDQKVYFSDKQEALYEWQCNHLL